MQKLINVIALFLIVLLGKAIEVAMIIIPPFFIAGILFIDETNADYIGLYAAPFIFVSCPFAHFLFHNFVAIVVKFRFTEDELEEIETGWWEKMTKGASLELLKEWYMPWK